MNMIAQTSDGLLPASVSEESSNPYQAEWNSLFCQKFYLHNLKSLALKGDLKACHFRSICWKIFLKCLPEDKELWIDTVKSQRQQYDEILDKYAANPRTNGSSDINVNNPLSQSQQNPWIQYFEDTELKTTIEQDVVRTFPEIDFFHEKSIRVMMISILFSYAREYPNVTYKQGMHELLAPILFVLKYDVEGYLEYSKENKLDLDLHILLNQNYLEHDAYFLFCQLMNAVEPWYTSSDCSYSKYAIAAEPFIQKVSSAPTNCLGQRLKRIYEQLLKQHDNELFQRLEELEITPQIFGIRWLRLLFGREFSMPDLLIVWDALFADCSTLDLVDFIFVGMLKSIRDLLLPCDYASCLTHLMRYPNISDVRFIIDFALHLRNPGGYSFPTGKIVNPLLLKAVKDNKVHSFCPKINSSKTSGRDTSYVNKANDKRPNSFAMILRSSAVESNSSSESSNLVHPLPCDFTSEQNEFCVEDYETNISRSVCENSFPRTKISNVMESKSCADQISKILNEDLQSNSFDMSKSSVREMVSLSRPLENSGKKTNAKNKRSATENVSLANSLDEEKSELRLIVDCCAKQLTLHLDKLQKTMVCQNLLHEDEIYLALAGLKRVRDILKGTVCISEVIKDDLDPYTVYDSSTASQVTDLIQGNEEKNKYNEENIECIESLRINDVSIPVPAVNDRNHISENISDIVQNAYVSET